MPKHELTTNASLPTFAPKPLQRVTRVTLVRSSGYPRLDSAALEALRGWRFSAALEEGFAVPSEFTHTVRFRIE